MAGLQPSLEWGCEVWNTNKCQAKALESTWLCAFTGKYILVCSRTTCNEQIWVWNFEIQERFSDSLWQVLTPNAFGAFRRGSTFDKALFCLGQNMVC